MKICWQSELQLDRSRIVELLREFGDLFSVPLSERIDLATYAEMILAYARGYERALCRTVRRKADLRFLDRPKRFLLPHIGAVQYDTCSP